MMADVVPLNAWKGQLELGDRGIRKTTQNLALCLRNLPQFGSKLRYNELADAIEWDGIGLYDTDYVDMRIILEQEHLPFDKREVPEVVARVARDNSFNPIQTYLKSLKWDGKPRLDSMLRHGFGAADIPIVSAFGRMFMISAVARAMDPGCQVDTTLILEGEQGIRKSSAVSALFGEQFVHHGLSVFRGQEAGLALQGRWAIDLGELAGFKANELRVIKDFLTRRTDNYRPLYARHVMDRPRRVVFVGQTNETNYLDDPTGGRRFWPVACTAVNIPVLAQHRDQLWAEAMHRYEDKEIWWIERGTQLDKWASAEQKGRFRQDIWAIEIDQFLASDDVHQRGCVLVSEILNRLGFKPDRRDAASELRVAGHLRFREWTKAQRRMHGQKAQWWFPPNAKPDEDGVDDP